jgi:DNA-binding XRE family transcriptional regulator
MSSALCHVYVIRRLSRVYTACNMATDRPYQPLADAALRFRSHADLSQRELARRAGVTRLTVTNLESGAVRPFPETLEKIARVLAWDRNAQSIDTMRLCGILDSFMQAAGYTVPGVGTGSEGEGARVQWDVEFERELVNHLGRELGSAVAQLWRMQDTVSSAHMRGIAQQIEVSLALLQAQPPATSDRRGRLSAVAEPKARYSADG